MVSGHVMLGPEVAPMQNVFAGQGNNSLRGPNTQVNDPTFDNIQTFAGFRPFLHFTQSDTTVAAHEKNIVVSYNSSAGITLEPFAPGILVFSRVLLSGYSFSSDGGKTFTSGFVPPDICGEISYSSIHCGLLIALLQAAATSETVC